MRVQPAVHRPLHTAPLLPVSVEKPRIQDALAPHRPGRVESREVRHARGSEMQRALLNKVEAPRIRPPLVVTGRRNAKIPRSPTFLRFREDLRSRVGLEGWRTFRRAAVAMFGDDGLVKVRGIDSRLLSLNRAQLRTIAHAPERVARHLRDDGIPPTQADENAAIYARSAKKALNRESNGRVSLTVATVNDDFTDRKTNLRHVDADVILAQETKNTRIRRAVEGKGLGVHQDLRSDDRAGSAVLWDRSRVKAGKRGLALGVKPNGRRMLTRWLSFTDVTVDGKKVRMVSAHRPPARFKSLWPAFDRNLADFVKRSRGNIVVGMDANQRNPEVLERLTGLTWHAPRGSIDGFLVSKGIRVEHMRRLEKRTSDHHPVRARITLPA